MSAPRCSPYTRASPRLSFFCKDSSGKTVSLNDYRGKVVVLDFWATWCHGCQEEIPWFSDFHRRYAGQGLAVVGVSLDSDGWKVVTPFLKTAKVPYQVVLGNDAMAKTYGIENMPDTFLLDRQGRIAAAYTGEVDKDNVEANLRNDALAALEGPQTVIADGNRSSHPPLIPVVTHSYTPFW